MVRLARVAAASAAVEVRLMAAEPWAFAILVMQPLLVASVSVFLLRGRSDFDALYVVAGTALTGLWSFALLVGSNIMNGDRWAGVLEYMEAAPAPLMAALSGRMLGALGFSLLSGVVGYIVAVWGFGYPLVVRQPVAFAISAALALLSLWAMGMLLAPLSLLWMAFARFVTGLEYPVYILGGFLFPIALLPGWLHPISYALPAYWGAAALHGSGSLDAPLGDLLIAWGLLLATSIVTVAIAVKLFDAAVRRSRRTGLLGAV